MSVTVLPQGRQQFFDNDGAELVGGQVLTLVPGTSTPKDTYTDFTGGTTNTNPVILNARGEAAIYWGGAYDVILKDANGVTIWGPERVVQPEDAGAVDELRADLASANSGDELIAVYRSDLPGVVATTQHEVNRSLAVYVEYGFGFTRGTGLSGAVRTANGAAINAAIVAAKAIGSDVFLPPGTSEYDGTLVAANGVNVYGRGNMGETDGSLFTSTVLKYYGNSYALDMLGTSASVATRIQCTWSHMVIDGSGAGAAAQGVRIGWNMRSNPLLRCVTFVNIQHYGMNFADQNWNVSFDCVRLDNCGNTAANSAGIFKNPAVDSGTFNAIEFHDLQVEGCGSSSSAAGGINMQTTTANRGLHFSGTTIVEGNKGTDEIFISNMADLVFDNLYIERLNVAGQTTGLEISGCKGAIHGGYVTGENVTNNLVGIAVKDNSDMQIDGVTTATWADGGIVNTGSKVYSGRNPSATYANGDANAQWFGDYAPRVSADKNSTNQTGIITATFTKVTFGTERYDLTDAYASSTYTPQTIGTHHIESGVGWVSMGATGDRMDLCIYLNGSLFKNAAFYAQGTGLQFTQISADIDINATTDTIEIYARQQSGSNKDISGSAADTWFMAHLVGRI